MRLPLDGLCALSALLLASVAGSTPAQTPKQTANSTAGVSCRAMEVQTDAVKRTAVVVFHHASEADRPALADFLRAHSGAAVEITIEGSTGDATPGTVFRLKSCFGRGLLLLPAAADLKEGTVFHLRLPELRAAAGGGHE
jgi:hypothetical protein